MKQKLTLLLATVLLIGIILPIYSSTEGAEKPKALPISKAIPTAPLSQEQNKSTIFCVIQNDDGTPVSFGAGFDSGMGLATYLDPTQCSGYPIYPFRITDVHLYLYDQSSFYTWPVKIQVIIKNATLADKCLGPDTLTTLYSQSFTIPVDSSYANLYPHPMNLTLSTPLCVYQPFFLEIDYLTHPGVNDTLPAMLLDESLLPGDTCTNWGYLGDNIYFNWPGFWVGSPPGDVIIRASGYTHASECDTGWYWKADRINAPSGMPDFNQNQDEWVSYCGPAAAANCLWWYGAVPVSWSPPQLIDTLARYFHTNPSWGTFVDTMQMGLDQYFEDYSLPYQTHLYAMPFFHEMEESLKVSQDVILLLGKWEQVAEDSFIRTGGHYVTMAGVNSESLKVAFSDPDWNHAEDGYPGRVRPPHAAHPSDPLMHNDPTYVSQDIYISTETSPSPGNPHWGITDYPAATGLSPAFDGKNFHPSQLKYYSPAREGKNPTFIEVDYALMVCPKVSAVEEEETPNVPREFELYQNYPNPFNPVTTIHFTVHRPPSAVRSPYPTTLNIYNILGQKVKTLVDEAKPEGSYDVVWDGKDEKGNRLASGIYFYRLQIGDQSQTKRMLLLK
jgi:hypothetical protein